MPKPTIKLFTPKVILLSLVLLITACSLGLFAYYLLRNHQRTMRFQDALTQLDAGNTAFAKQLLSISINEDPNNELAFVKMAEIMAQEGHWNNASILWRRAAILNPLKAEYRQAEIQMMLRGRLYNKLASALELDSKSAKLSPLQNCYLAYANYQLDRQLLAETIFQAINDRDTLLSPMAKLLEVVLNPKKSSLEVQLLQLAELAKASDPVVAFEALELLARQFTLDGERARAEDALIRAQELNPECARPLLGEFYFFTGNLDAAIPILQEILQEGLNPAIALMLGEAYASQNRLDDIQELSKQYRSGNKGILQVGTYLDALLAFGRQDLNALQENISRISGVFKTPVALMMSLHAAAHARDLKGITQVIKDLRSSTHQELLPEAQAIIMPLIRTFFDEQNLGAAANLAELFRDPDQPDLFLTRVWLAGNFEKQILSRNEILGALQNFPDDPLLLRIAAAHAMQNRRFDEALGYIEHNLAKGNKELLVRQQHILALQNSGRIDDSIDHYRELLKEQPDNRSAVYGYFTLLVNNNRVDELQELLTERQQRPEAEERYLVPYIEAELALLDKDFDGMTAILKKAVEEQPLDEKRSEDVELIYRCAYLFALMDDSQRAIELYERIAERYPMPIMIQLNLAELYASIGKPDKALELAQAAWQSNGSLLATQECLGLRLVENKRFARAVQLLGLPVDSKKATPRALDAWRVAMEALIKDAFAAKKYLECITLSEQLLRHFSGNQLALDHLAQSRSALGDAAP